MDYIWMTFTHVSISHSDEASGGDLHKISLFGTGCSARILCIILMFIVIYFERNNKENGQCAIQFLMFQRQWPESGGHWTVIKWHGWAAENVNQLVIYQSIKIASNWIKETLCEPCHNIFGKLVRKLKLPAEHILCTTMRLDIFERILGWFVLFFACFKAVFTVLYTSLLSVSYRQANQCQGLWIIGERKRTETKRTHVWDGE